jgi:hypothetical protein
MYLKPTNKGDDDTFISLKINEIPYLFFKNFFVFWLASAYSKKFFKFEFLIAKGLFYVATTIFRRKVRRLLIHDT